MTNKLVESRWFVILISLIWGFGLALLFKRVCSNGSCVIVKVPPEFLISGERIVDQNGCYALTPYLVPCEY